MSLFIGKTVSGKSIIHITNKEESVDIMRNGTILPSTTFHSDIQYLTYNSYNVEHIEYDEWHGRVSILTFPREARQKISDGYPFFCTYKNTSNNFIYMNSMGFYKGVHHEVADIQFGYPNLFSTEPDRFNNVFGSFDVNYTPKFGTSINYLYLVYYGDYRNHNNIQIHFLNIKKFDYEPKTFTSSSSVEISSTKFIVNNEQILKTKYISPERINNIDPTVIIQGHEFQLVNYYEPDINSVSIETNSNGVTNIKANNKTIFTSEFINPTLSYSMKYESGYLYKYRDYPYGGGYDIIKTFTDLGKFKDNDLIVIQFLLLRKHHKIDYSRIPHTMILKYKSPLPGEKYKKLGMCFYAHAESIYSPDGYFIYKNEIWADENGYISLVGVCDRFTEEGQASFAGAVVILKFT